MVADDVDALVVDWDPPTDDRRCMDWDDNLCTSRMLEGVRGCVERGSISDVGTTYLPWV